MILPCHFRARVDLLKKQFWVGLNQRDTPQDVGPFFRRNFTLLRGGVELDKTNRGSLTPTRSQTRLGLAVWCGGDAQLRKKLVFSTAAAPEREHRRVL